MVFISSFNSYFFITYGILFIFLKKYKKVDFWANFSKSANLTVFLKFDSIFKNEKKIKKGKAF